LPLDILPQVGYILYNLLGEREMSSIVPVLCGNKKYLYLSTSFRNDNGKPDTKRKCIGSIDPDNNTIIFNKYYIQYLIDNNIDINEQLNEVSTKFGATINSIKDEFTGTNDIKVNNYLTQDNDNSSENKEELELKDIKYTFSCR
jgi:hypothetical protein